METPSRGGDTRPGASTYGGNPVCAAAALATIDFHVTHALGRRSTERGATLLESLRRLTHGRAHVHNPRGRGLMIAVDVVGAVDKSSDPARCDRILESLKDHGVLAGKTGPGRNVLTLLPPLTVTDQEIGELTDALQHCL